MKDATTSLKIVVALSEQDRQRSTDAVVQLIVSFDFISVYVWMDKQLSLLYGWHLLNVQQAKYLFSNMFTGANVSCDVINALWPKAQARKSFLVCFDNEVNTTIYSK